MAAAIYPSRRDAQTADMLPVRLNEEGDTLMPIFTAQPEASPTTQPGAALPRPTQHAIENQIAELYGEVATSEHRRMLEREALAVPGVRVVINHVSVPQELDPHVHTANR